MKNNKSLGQHWLKNREILDEIADLALVDGDLAHLCLEIGPGLGTLTSSLLRRFERVIAIEYDERLAANLPKSFPGKNLEVIHGDILETEIAQLVGDRPYVVVGNIPYYITSPIIQKLINTVPSPQRIVLLIQKEVAKRIAAEPGNHSILSLMVQNKAAVELGQVVTASEFTPPPKVDSQVIRLTPLAKPQVSVSALDLAKKGFSSPRKKLVANLATPSISKADWREILGDLNLNPDARAEDLTLWDWEKLAKKLLEKTPS